MKVVAAVVVMSVGLSASGAALAACAAGHTCGTMVDPNFHKPIPVGATTITYPTGHPPKPVDPHVYDPRPIKPLPRSAEANAGRKAYCGKNPFKCGE